MRIGIPMKSYDATWGGPGTYTIELVERLVRAGGDHEYVLIFPGDVESRSAATGRASEPNVREIRTRRHRGLVWDQHDVAQVAAREKIDLLFSPFMSIPLRGRYKKVFTLHGAERYVVPRMLPSDQNAKWIFMERMFVPMADRIIAVSDTMARDFRAAVHCPAERIRSVYLGVGSEFSPMQDARELEAVRRRHELPDHFLLFVGRIFPNKNFSNLLRGFAASEALGSHQLIVVGGVRWKFEEDLRLAASLGIASRVRFLDFVPRRDLVGLYGLATCLVYPSYYESFGLVQLEAMACGCPVVAAKAGALPEIARDAAVYCDPHDPRTIGAAIDMMIGDPALRAAHVRAGIERAREFTWERCAAETLRVLEEA